MHSIISQCDLARKIVRIRGGSGLGDSLYVQSIARYLIEQGNEVEACTDWPDVFRPLNGCCSVSPFRRDNIDKLCHYSLRRSTQTDQFTDCCLQAGIRHSVPLRLDWRPENAELIRSVRGASAGKPIILVQLPRLPMDRKDGFGAELLPDCRVIQSAIDAIRPHAYVVQIGKGEPLFRFEGLDLDLANVTSISELIDLANIANGCLGYVSFMVPLAESLDKPALFVWSRRGLNSRQMLIRQLTPDKVRHRCDLSICVIDDCSRCDMVGAVNAFIAKVGSPATV